MKTIISNLNFSLMTNSNFIATIVVATVLMLTSCASEVFYIPSDNDQTIALTVTHEFGFNFTEGDVISVFKVNEEYEQKLVGELLFDKESNTFRGNPNIAEGDSCRLVFNNAAKGENSLVYIPSSQALDMAIPLEKYTRWGATTLHFHPLMELSQLRIPLEFENRFGYVSLKSASSMGMVGMFYLDGIYPNLYAQSELVYKINDQQDYVDIFFRAGEYKDVTLEFIDARGNFLHGYIYDKIIFESGLTLWNRF